MAHRFEELAWDQTTLGLISLRRRVDPTLGIDVFEVKLGEEFLMSSLFTVAEVALARLALARLQGEHLTVVVGGLGLGYTAMAALADDRVGSLTVVEALPAVIDWHERDLLPDTAGLAADRRTTVLPGDFFALVRDGEGFGDVVPGTMDAVLLDVDHSPRHLLHPSHADFYTVPGLRRLRRYLRPGGVFALWSDDPPDPGFVEILDTALEEAHAEVVRFTNPLTAGTSANTIYLARG